VKPNDQQQWTLFKELDIRADADKLRLAAFLNRLQQSAPADTKRAPVQQSADLALSPERAASLSFERAARATAPRLPEKLTATDAEQLLSRLLDGYSVPAPELRWLLREAAVALAALPTVVELPPLAPGQTMTVVGDIHGQLTDLATAFEAAGGCPSEDSKFIFNGDFVDRGEYSIEVLAVLLTFALALPGSCHLNRGNHEDRLLCQAYGFRAELQVG
jgi:hypothetical protein